MFLPALYAVPHTFPGTFGITAAAAEQQASVAVAATVAGATPQQVLAISLNGTSASELGLVLEFERGP